MKTLLFSCFAHFKALGNWYQPSSNLRFTQDFHFNCRTILNQEHSSFDFVPGFSGMHLHGVLNWLVCSVNSNSILVTNSVNIVSLPITDSFTTIQILSRSNLNVALYLIQSRLRALSNVPRPVQRTVRSDVLAQTLDTRTKLTVISVHWQLVTVSSGKSDGQTRPKVEASAHLSF